MQDLAHEELGYRVGFLGSVYFVGTFIASIVFGRMADVIGRKKTLQIGLSGTVVAVLLFGFSTNFYMALVARFLWGLLNGNLGVVKTVRVVEPIPSILVLHWMPLQPVFVTNIHTFCKRNHATLPC